MAPVHTSSSLFDAPDVIPQLAPLQKGQRSIMPRGCRFRDLSEAHRNITGRSLSNGTRTGSESSRTQTSSSGTEDIALRDLARSRENTPVSEPTVGLDEPCQPFQEHGDGIVCRDGAATRLGFRDEADALMCPGSISKNSIAKGTSMLVPLPLRVQSVKGGGGKHLSGRSGTAASSMTTDSDEDPFRYDKNAYKIFLHPSKEREVSAALKHISGLSSHSQATLYSQDELPGTRSAAAAAAAAPRKSSLQPPPIPKEYLESPSAAVADRAARSPTPESGEDGFYDTSVIQPSWAGGGGGTYEVKVVLQDGQPSRDSLYARPDQNSRPPVPEKTLERVREKADGLPQENTLVSDRDEWETVATSAMGFGSIGRSFARRTVPSPVLSRPGRVKVTGDSVADVSDEEVGDGGGGGSSNLAFCQYASTDRIVQHPSGQTMGRDTNSTNSNDDDESLRIRHLHGSRIPIIVPKQRVHRVNGFAQDSTRLTGSHRASSNPFRDLRHRHHRFSPMPLPVLQARLSALRSRSQASDKEAILATTWADRDSSSASSQSSRHTAHSFSFPLIPLPEAARLQASQRHDARTWRHNASVGMAADTSWATTTTKTTTTTTTTTVSSAAARLLRAAALKLRLDSIGSKLEKTSLSTRRGLVGMNVVPRLYPWDYPRRHPQQQRSTDPELRAIADASLTSATPATPATPATTTPATAPVDRSQDSDLERSGVPLDPDAFLPRAVRRRRRAWFAALLALSALLPFVAVLVYCGRCDGGLAWYTRGAVSRLSRRQRRLILGLLVLQLVLWPSVLMVVIWRYRQ